LLSNLRNHTYYILRLYKNLNKLLDFVLIAKTKAKTKFATRAVVIREETLIINKVLTVTANYKRYYSKKYKLCELASVNKSTTKNKTISNTTVFKNAFSC
jgi:hypothetical protein